MEGARYETRKHATDETKFLLLDTLRETAVTVSVLGPWVYVRKARKPELIGGIVIPDKSREDTTFAEIIAVGTEARMHPRQAGLSAEKWRKKCAKKPELKVWPCLDEVHVGDLLTAPDNHDWAIKEMNYLVRNEGYIHVCVLGWGVEV